MKPILFILVFYFPMTLLSQDERYDEFIPEFKSDILSESSLESNKLTKTLRNLTFIGAHKELYEMDSYVDTTLTEVFEEIINDYKLIDAKEYILSRSEDEKILIINESHHRPEHRHFTETLLPKLYEQGFRYLALEALFTNRAHWFYHYPLNQYNLGDTTILTRGYPLMKICSGTYVKEPAFGNMIRKAIDLGFKLVGYEANVKGREKNQAKNIAKIYDYDPNAKIVVHCGYGHLIETAIVNKKGDTLFAMAGHLKDITGINPYTIDQTEYYNYENVSETVFVQSKKNSPQVLLKDGLPFKSHRDELQEYWDMTIFHAPNTFIEDRPAWLVQSETNRVFEPDLEQITIKYPVRIKLHELNDRLDAVPIDVMEIDSAQAKCKLYGDIEKGKFVVQNKNGDRQIINIPY